MRIAASSLVCLLLLLVLVPARVHAGGLELLPGGTVSVARGGAVAARPEDATAMLHNPAGLAFLNSNQVTFDLDLSLREMCVDPYGFYGWGVYKDDASSEFGDPLAVDNEKDPTIGATYATTPLPKVCNSGAQVPVPNLAWVGKFGEDFALGIGIVAPTVVTGTNYGGHDGTIANPDPNSDLATLPTPTRYAIIDQEVGAVAASVSVAYRLIPQLALGATVTLLSLRVKSRAMQNATDGTQPALDWLVDVDAQDYFLPTVTISAHVQPMRGLNASAALRWVDDFDGHGKVTYETNTFHEDATSGSVPYRNDAVNLSMVRVGLPWAASVGVRYAGMLPDPADKAAHLGDPMDTELWDVEADGTYNFNARGSKNRVRAAGDISIVTRTADGGGDVTHVDADKLDSVSVDRHLKDSIALRLGGSYSIAPRKVAMHAGVFYENRGIDPAYADISSFAFARVGFGLGAIMRVGDFDLEAAYGHIFQETMQIAPPEHQNKELYDQANSTSTTTGFDKRVGGSFDVDGTRIGGTVLEDPDAPSPQDADAVARLKQSSPIGNKPRVINAGEYTASFNIISVGAVYHF